MAKIAIVGTGYVGLVTGTCLAECGHKVVCCDISDEKINMLKNGQCPIYEAGLEELIEKNTNSGNLSFTTDVGGAIRDAETVFSAVGTPMGENYEADLSYVKAVAKTFAENLDEYKVFVNKSTVPVGTGDIVKKIILENSSVSFDVVSNPEFLREGNAVEDFLKPDRIIVGCESEKARDVMKNIYEPFERNHHPVVFTDIKSAELIKYASNSMLATRISFMNEIARFCDIVGANVEEVAKGMGYDARIGPKFLQAGIGYGGSCFPKDVAALIESGKEKNYDFEILNAVQNVNNVQKTLIVDKIKSEIGSLEGKKIALWGLAFKPGTDDVREAPSAYIAKKLIDEKVSKINAYDIVAQKSFKADNPGLEIEYYENCYDAVNDCDVLLVLTQWDEFKVLDYDKLNEMMRGKLIADGRNMYNPEEVRGKGFSYIGIGRS